MSWTKVVAKILLWAAAGLAALVALGAALFYYFVYTPAPEPPHLSGALSRGALELAGIRRTYSLYLPHDLKPNAPLVVALHGSDGNAAQMRTVTGYAFERLADAHGFALVYPNGFEGNWNACNIVGDYSANALNIDDVEFLTGLADRLVSEIGVDPSRVFATGISRGGHMAFRLAIEAPSRFRAVAAVAANVPTPENFKCEPVGQGASSVMIMNGTRDPLNPFDGGEVNFLGLYGRGAVRSSIESGQYFAELNNIAGAPETRQNAPIDGVHVERHLWRGDCNVEVELVAIHGGGHVMPQPYWRSPRILGPTPREPNGPALIWAFFERQRVTPFTAAVLRGCRNGA